MSALAVRTAVKAFLATEAASEKLVDLSDQFGEMRDLLAANSITAESPFLAIEFAGGEEIPITINAGPNKGKHRETGMIYLHVVARAKLAVSGSILTRAEALRNLFRGRRISVGGNTFVVTEVTPPNFGEGAAIDFGGGYTSASFIVGYEYDLDL